MKLLACILVSATLCLATSLARAQKQNPEACPPEVQDVLAAALTHALEDAKDLPDLGFIVQKQRTVYVLNYLWENECVIDQAVLPRSTEPYVLVSREKLSDLAREQGEDVAYVRAGDVQIGEEEGQLSLGVSIQQVPGEEQPLQCCCGGKLMLRRSGNVWRFVEWRNIVCA